MVDNLDSRWEPGQAKKQGDGGYIGKNSSYALFFCTLSCIDIHMSEFKQGSETANSFVNRILEKLLPQILVGEAVAVPDDDEEMNWRLFFGTVRTCRVSPRTFSPEARMNGQRRVGQDCETDGMARATR